MNKQKDDNGKLRWDLLPLDVVEKLVEIYEFGANKYEENSWRTIENGYKRCRAALFRHLTAYDKGEQVDPESGKSHLAHAAWNALSMVYFAERDTLQEMHDKAHRITYKDGHESSALKLLKEYAHSCESSKLIDEFDTDALLYVYTANGHHVLIKNAKGRKMYSMEHEYFISEPIESLSNYKEARLATEYEQAVYDSYGKYKYEIGQPVTFEGSNKIFAISKRMVSKRTLKRAYYIEPIGWYDEDEIIPYINNQPNETTILHQEG